MEYDKEKYNGVFYCDKSYYPETTLQPAMAAFLNGDIAPMVSEINQEQYNHLSFSLSPPTSITNKHVSSLVGVIAKTPSVTHFSLRADINSTQATKITQQIAGRNIYDFALASNKLTSNGMSEFFDTLSDSNVRNLSIRGYLDDRTIASMPISETHLEVLTFSNLYASERGFLKIFENLYGSSVKDLAIFDQELVSAEIAEKINLSRTNITELEFDNVNFSGDALSHLQFKGSKVTYLMLDAWSLHGNLAGLSKSLQGSDVKTLIIDAEYGELSQLQLSGTNVENLQLHDFDGFESELADLHLQGTHVKTLDLSANRITDQDLMSLDLKNTSIEHLILDYNQITDAGRALIPDLIKDTHIKDVSLARFDFSKDNLVFEEYMLINQHILPDGSAPLLPEKQAQVLQLSDVMNDSADLFESETVIPLVNTEPQLQAIHHISHPLLVEANFDLM